MIHSTEIVQVACKDSYRLFPRVVLLNIYYYLDTKSLFNCSLVSKHFSKLFDSDLFWDRLICDHYGADYIDKVKQSHNVTEPKIIYKIIGDLLIVNNTFDLQNTIEELLNLQTLDFYNTWPANFPKDLPLENLPQEIGSLINLQNFDLDSTGITKLSREIGSLVNLQCLYLNNNKLTELPKEIGSLNNLQELNVGDNQLTKIPKEIGSLVNLQELYLSNNHLTELPKEIGSLVNLQELYLSNNHLTELPKEIGSLVNLQELYLSNNQLTELPQEIGSLVSLRSLHITNNQLTEIPEEIESLANAVIIR